MMLITPAIASVPYWAAAPSCSTSTWSMADTGMKFRSVAAPPWNGPPSTARLAVVWRRLPLTSTRVSLGDRPRRRADRVRLAASPPKAWAVNEGRFCAIAWIRSGWPVRSSEVESSTWMGEAESMAFKPFTRVPVTITASSLMSGLTAVAASAAAGVRTATCWALAGATCSRTAMALATASETGVRRGCACGMVKLLVVGMVKAWNAAVPPALAGRTALSCEIPGPGPGLLFARRRRRHHLGGRGLDFNQAARHGQGRHLQGRAHRLVRLRAAAEELAVSGVQAGEIHLAVELGIAHHEDVDLDHVGQAQPFRGKQLVDLAEDGSSLGLGVAVGFEGALGRGRIGDVGQGAADEHQAAVGGHADRQRDGKGGVGNTGALDLFRLRGRAEESRGEGGGEQLRSKNRNSWDGDSH